MDKQGFDSIFNDAATQFASSDEITEFKRFRDAGSLYSFVHGGALSEPDVEAIGKSFLINPSMTYAFSMRTKTDDVGYSNPSQFKQIDICDSRHIMMMTFLHAHLPVKEWKNVVEIGAGYGNWLRLAYGLLPYEEWTMIDLPFVSRLQRWYLEQEEVEGGTFVDNYKEWKKEEHPITLAIGAHSMSEFSWDIFYEYLDSVVNKANYFFYATHVYFPEINLVNEKLLELNRRYETVAELVSENGKVRNILFKVNHG